MLLGVVAATVSCQKLVHGLVDPGEEMELLGQAGGPNAEQEAAYDALLAKNQALGGGFGDEPVVDNSETYYFELQNPNGQGQTVPPLINNNNPNTERQKTRSFIGVSPYAWNS